MNQNTFKPDMRVEIRHVRRKQLAPFLPDEIAKTIKTTKDKGKKVRRSKIGNSLAELPLRVDSSPKKIRATIIFV